ncbi:MAG TPA: hypothetical protein VLW86_06460, partial [Syntrophorhabdales bacterium]|nr:hypothetical protein [Syntrophorhabdales bacterium]
MGRPSPIQDRKLPAGRPMASAVPYLIAAAILFILPLVLPSYYLSVLTMILIFGLFAMSLNIIFGHTGLNSLGHAAFFGMAGYIAGISIVTYGIK